MTLLSRNIGAVTTERRPRSSSRPLLAQCQQRRCQTGRLESPARLEESTWTQGNMAMGVAGGKARGDEEDKEGEIIPAGDRDGRHHQHMDRAPAISLGAHVAARTSPVRGGDTTSVSGVGTARRAESRCSYAGTMGGTSRRKDVHDARVCDVVVRVMML